MVKIMIEIYISFKIKLIFLSFTANIRVRYVANHDRKNSSKTALSYFLTLDNFSLLLDDCSGNLEQSLGGHRSNSEY